MILQIAYGYLYSSYNGASDWYYVSILPNKLTLQGYLESVILVAIPHYRYYRIT